MVIMESATTTLNSKPIQIRQVWHHNLTHEFNIIRTFLPYYPYVSMDTEFPGVVHKPDPSDPTPPNRRPPPDQYRLIKKNVDELELIQLGLTLSDHNGNLPDIIIGGVVSSCIWEFNFCDFDPTRHTHNPDSIALLARQGIDFSLNRAYGIRSPDFVAQIWHSGLLYNRSVTWVSFHSAYDFAYLIKIMRRAVLGVGALPDTLDEFLRVLQDVFGNVYDVKHVMQFCDNLYGGLEQVARVLKVDREAGVCHQAGSDSLLTWRAFAKMRDTYFDRAEPQMLSGILYGLKCY